MGSARSRLWLTMGGLALVVLVGGGGLLALVASGEGSPTGPRDVAADYLEAWERRDWKALRALVAHPTAAVVGTYRDELQTLGVEDLRTRLLGLTGTAAQREARFRVTMTLTDDQALTYRGSIHLAEARDRWRVEWSPESVHPDLRAGYRFTDTRSFPERAPILAVDATPLTVAAPVVDVGIEPQRVKDRAEVTGALQRSLGLDPANVIAALDAPGVQPNWFVAVVTVPEAQYQAVRPDLYWVPGLVFRRHFERAGATPQLGAHVVGRTGPVTAELLEELGPGYQAGDVVGRSGLERAFERRLAGTPARTLAIADEQGASVSTLKVIGGSPGEAVRTTIDLRTQTAAEQALTGVTQPAAIVAADPSTGEIRAIVSTPIDVEFDRALDGAYPPGSTFKIVTTAALLAHGTTPSTSTTCPPTFTVDGRAFHNFEGEAEPELTFAEAFTTSCNTAFLQLAQALPDGALAEAAARFGFGEKPQLPLAAVGARFPTPKSATEQAASAIGQGRVTASPLAMAEVAAAVASGAWHAPSLVLEPEPNPGPPPPRALEPGVADGLRALMTSVVQRGTGTAAAVPGRTVAGKTGTGEFGEGEAPPTHAWFVGFSDDVAFAVLVEGGGVGGRVAAPIAGRFLRAL